MGPIAAQKYIENKDTDKTTYLERYFIELMSPVLKLDFFNKNISVGRSTHRPDFIVNDSLHINVDGVLFHSDKYQKDKMYHFNKRVAYESENRLLLQLRSDEIFGKPEIIKSLVAHKLQLSTNKVYARKCQLKDVSFKDVRGFLEKTHLMGIGPNAKAVCLTHGDEIVAVMTYSKKADKLEIVRFSVKLYHSVVGGFQKILKYLIAKEQPKEVISFVDLRYADGHSLTKSGFKLLSVSLGWQWVDKYSKGQNRLRCRASNGKSELANASELGWSKIYDAGQAKYILDLTEA
jgi:hypothetical protein